MATAQELIAKIGKINSVLQRGVTSTVVDGTTVTFDLDALARERAALQAELDTLNSQPVRRPFASNIWLGG